VEASIPAQARMELHRRALELATKNKAPLEVRAQHAAQAGESFTALMLLERMGNLALQRGDADTAVAGYQRGLGIARAEALETGDLGLDDAIATFSRKLGNALMHRGDVTGGEGVLREALEITRPGSLQRARMLLGLGEVVTARKRSRDAQRLLAQALEIAVQLKDVVCQADVHMAVAALHRGDGDVTAAIKAQQLALDLYKQAPGNESERVQCAVELAALEIQRDDWSRARDHLRDARALAQQAKAGNLVARIVGLSATIDARQGKPERAMDGYREAIRLAHEAGDAEGARYWQGTSQLLTGSVAAESAKGA
jgi:serine/threonine-protein kinase